MIGAILDCIVLLADTILAQARVWINWMVFGADGKPIDPSSISVMTGTTYDQEFAYEMEKLKVSLMRS